MGSQRRSGSRIQQTFNKSEGFGFLAGLGSAIQFLGEDVAYKFGQDAVEAMEDIIVEDGGNSRYPQTGRLAQSLEFYVAANGDVVLSASGDYAAVQVKDGSTTIRPVSAKRLGFFWYRIGRPVRAKSVVITGKNLFNRGAERAAMVLSRHIHTRLSEIAGKMERDAKGRFIKRTK